MNDEIVPTPENNPPKEITSVDKIIQKRRGTKRSILESLPSQIKADMERQMLEVSAPSCKLYMDKTYGKEYPGLFELKKLTYQTYQKKHRKRLEEEIQLKNQIAIVPDEYKNVIDAFTSPDIKIEDKKKALTALFNTCQSRRQLLELRNQTFLDPMIEGLILANVKEQRVIIEKITILSEQLDKDSQKDYLSEFQSFYRVILAGVDNVYKMVNGNTNYSEFRALLDTQLSDMLKQYRMEKDKLSKIIA